MDTQCSTDAYHKLDDYKLELERSCQSDHQNANDVGKYSCPCIRKHSNDDRHPCKRNQIEAGVEDINRFDGYYDKECDERDDESDRLEILKQMRPIESEEEIEKREESDYIESLGGSEELFRVVLRLRLTEHINIIVEVCIDLRINDIATVYYPLPLLDDTQGRIDIEIFLIAEAGISH